jgi:hypothetical protein
MLGNLSAILDKGAAFAEMRKIDPSVLVNARLAPDMLPLSRQVQIASDGAKGCAARLAGVEVPSYPDTETTFPELQDRIARTLEFLKTIAASQVDGSEERPVSLKFGGTPINLRGQDYLLTFALPHVLFHVTTAYDILRHNGVEIGKMDYLGSF